MLEDFDVSPECSDDEDYQTKVIVEYAPYINLKTLLNKPAHLSVFLNYTILENKPNNLLFVLCVHHYQRQEKTKDIRKAAEEIFRDFLNPSAVLKVSLSQKVVVEISKNLGGHKKGDPQGSHSIYNDALMIITRQVDASIREFKTKLDMGLGNAYNGGVLFGLDNREDEIRVAKAVLIQKFDELVKDTNDLNEEKNKALIAAIQYLLEDIGVLNPSTGIARSFSINKKDVEKVSKKLNSLRKTDNSKIHMSRLGLHIKNITDPFISSGKKESLVESDGPEEGSDSRPPEADELGQFDHQNLKLARTKSKVYSRHDLTNNDKADRSDKADKADRLSGGSDKSLTVHFTDTDCTLESTQCTVQRTDSARSQSSTDKRTGLARTHSNNDKKGSLVLRSSSTTTSLFKRFSGSKLDKKLPTPESPVKRSKSLPKDHSVQPKRPHPGPVRPHSAVEDGDTFPSYMISPDGAQAFPLIPLIWKKSHKRSHSDPRSEIAMKRQSLSNSDDIHSSNSSDSSSNRCSFLDPGTTVPAEERRSNNNLIEFEWDADFDIQDEFVLWSATFPHLIKQRNMNKKAIQRQDVIYELVHTERHYVRKLKVMNVVYYEPLIKNDILLQQQVIWLFPNLDQLIELHSAMIKDFEERMKEDNPINHVCDILIKHLSKPELKEACAKFCNHQKSALAMFKSSMRKEPRFAEFVAMAENHKVSRRLDVDQLIGSVLGRMSKYPLLLEALKKSTKDELCPDFGMLSEAIEKAKDLLTFVNLRIRETENAQRLEKLQKNIDNFITEEDENFPELSKMRINAPHRKLIHDGNLTLVLDKQHGNRQIELHGLLLTDCLVLLQKQDSRYILKAHGDDHPGYDVKSPVIYLNELHVSEGDKRNRGFIIISKSKVPQMYEMRTTSKDNKENWIKNLIAESKRQLQNPQKHLVAEPNINPLLNFPSSNRSSYQDTGSEEEEEEEEETSSEEETETESEAESEREDQTPIGMPIKHHAPITKKDTVLAMVTRPTIKKEVQLEKPMVLRSPPSAVDPILDELSDLTSQDLVLNAMKETQNIHKLSLAIGIDNDEDDSLKKKVTRSTATLNKNLRALLTSVINQSEDQRRLQDSYDALLAQVQDSQPGSST